MNGLDWLLVGISIFCILRGLFRGAISQIFGIAGALGGFLLASHYSKALAHQLLLVFPELSSAQLISFIVLLILTWFCIGVIGHWTAKFIYRTGLGFLDRLFGGVLGLGKALILAAIIITVLTIFLPPGDSILTQSSVAPFVKDGTRIAMGLVPEKLKDSFQDKQRELDRFIPERKEQKPQPPPHQRPEPPNRKPGDIQEKKEVSI